MTPNYISSLEESAKLPKARVEDLVVQKMENETLVYDLVENKAHHLNKTMSIVWENCNDKSSSDDLSRILANELDTEIEDDFIAVALSELEKVNLLEGEAWVGSKDTISRRKVLLRYALPAIAAPVVMSLVSPISAQVTASCLALEAACEPTSMPGCCPGVVCSGFEGTCVPEIMAE